MTRSSSAVDVALLNPVAEIDACQAGKPTP
jgi:hypothetical protein